MTAARMHLPRIAILTALLLLTLPAAVQAQLTYTTNNGTITITGYTGSVGFLVIPSTINGLPVTTIGDKAFWGRTDLTSVLLRQSVVTIGDQAFAWCTSLNSVYWFNVTNIGGSAFEECGNLQALPLFTVSSFGPYAFAGCRSLSSVTIGPVGTISGSAFAGCFSLTSVSIPNTVTNIEYAAFNHCVSLTSVLIPESVTTVGNSIFFGCASLSGIYFPSNAPNLGVFDFANASATVYYLPGTMGWGSTFGGCPTVLWNPQAQTSDASFGVHTNQFGFNITGTANIPIVVEANWSLRPSSGGDWTPLQSCTLTNGSIYFSDPQWTNYPSRFYRIRSP